MALDQRKRQRKLERKKAKQRAHLAKERQRRQVLTPETPRQMVSVAAEHSYYDVQVSDGLFDVGIGYVLVTRHMPLGGLLTVLFLTDVWCLGVKDVIVRLHREGEYRGLLGKLSERGRLRRVTPEHACKLVTESVAYARKYGLAPHSDYAFAQNIFAGIDPAACADQFQFGQDGKPHYVSGPNDTPERVRQILSTVGPENLHYTIFAGSANTVSRRIDDGTTRAPLLSEFEDLVELDGDDDDWMDDDEPA
ncbi:MAG: hypothetical protein L0211_07230 [Planctomycetaceae bacterium]|nr:hypothetical protein [Planctomycetaceae bacterium]